MEAYDMKVKNLLVEIGMPENEAEDCVNYLNGRLENSNFINSLPYIDMYMLEEEVQGRIRALYLDARKGSGDVSGNIFKLLFGIGKQSLFNLIKPYEI